MEILAKLLVVGKWRPAFGKVIFINGPTSVGIIGKHQPAMHLFIGPIDEKTLLANCGESLIFLSQSISKESIGAGEKRAALFLTRDKSASSIPRKSTDIAEMGSNAANSGEQIQNGLPQLTRFITTHDSSSGKSIVHSKDSAPWTTYDDQTMGFSVMYTTSEFPTSLNDDKDIKDYEKVAASGKLGLVNPRGTVCRVVDFGPMHKPLMHRTQSLDYGIVLEGKVEMELDSGEVHMLHRGDVAVQRATMHCWRNPSKTEWARMIFVLQDCQPLTVQGQQLKEDLGHGTGGPQGLPPSGNDS